LLCLRAISYTYWAHVVRVCVSQCLGFRF
jgi:hypothetical protein